MTKSARVRFWIAVSALLPAIAGARAQDVFANTSTPTPSYESQASSSCEEANHQHLAIDSPDPARCFNPVPAVNGYCSPIGGAESTLALQQGNLCYYCQQAPMPGKEIVIPSTGGASLGIDSYQWMCTSNPSAPACYLSCFGNFPSPTFPPGSSVDKETEPNGDPVFKIKISNEPEPQASTPNPCFPAGPKNYNVCDYPNLTRPPGCECTKTPTPQPTAQPTPQPGTPTTSQPPNEGQYLQGLVDGIGTCLQSLQANLLGLAAGAGYFAKLDFVHAAELWGVQPGQSAILNALSAQLKTMTTELNTPVVGKNVTSYSLGVAGGKRLCQYFLIPAAKQALGAAVKGGAKTTGSSPPEDNTPKITGTGGKPAQLPGGNGGTPPKLPGGSTTSGTSPPQLPGGGRIPLLPGPVGDTQTVPVGGDTQTVPVAGDTQTVPVASGGVPSVPAGSGNSQPTVPAGAGSGDATGLPGGDEGSSASNPLRGSDLQAILDKSPKSLPGKYAELPDGRTIQIGQFLGKGGFADVYKYGDLVLKLSKNDGTYGYGPASLAGQNQGAQRLQGTGVQAPKVYDYQPGNGNTPASLVTDDANTAFPGYKEITPADFQAMTPTQQGQVLKAITGLTNAIAEHGYVLGDPNPTNIRIKATSDGYQAMLIDTDLIMTPAEIRAEVMSQYKTNQLSVPVGVINWGLELAGQQNFNLSTATPQSLTDVLNQARANRLSGAQNAAGAAVNTPDGTVVQ